MSEAKTYASPSALLAAVTDRAKKDAKERGVPVQRLLREFEFSRLLARVFAEEGDGRWVLKGGQAMLVRLPDPRTTRDIDLLHRTNPSDLEVAVSDLRAAIEKDLGDFFVFGIAKVEAIHENSEQTGVQCRRVTVSVRCGTKQKSPIQIDVSADSCMTQLPEQGSFPAVALPSIAGPNVVVYPTVDHIADKVSATAATYAHGRPSSRERDMADLALFALTSRVDGATLRKAITAEWAHRGLSEPMGFEPPENWRTRYSKLAQKVPALVDYLDFDEALTLITSFLDPVFAGEASISTWNPSTLTWEPTARHREGDTA